MHIPTIHIKDEPICLVISTSSHDVVVCEVSNEFNTFKRWLFNTIVSFGSKLYNIFLSFY